ncbi:hypothetical protein J7T55_000302 [Diaporthe amygdali]|uniref:uncharacterized protein n=1 Tax=Phomopsis amygdali TaxID=1214568 RepID=UPI0022FE345F|nr:uncharacterized protein J7T55_000302 [Diaporthe amygdali]KAJ0109377.1 hypothetical protein J7T55_000302 [Diaporthe amygdali]
MDGYDLSKVPLGMAPPGQTVNLAEGPSQAWMPRLAIYTTLPVAFGFLVLRLFARLRMRIALGMDDFIDDIVGLGVVGTVTDFYIITIPLTAISGLNMSLARKIGVSTLFATGLLACSFSAAGLASRLDNYRTTLVRKYPDPFWTSMPAYGLAIAEINLGIVCACVPAAFPIFKGLAEKSSTRWDSWRNYRSRSRTPSKPPQDNSKSTSNVSEPHQGLPNVPRGTLQTLLSFVKGSQSTHRGDKSQGTITVTKDTDIEMRPYSELRSGDFENMYHSHLYQQGSQRNLAFKYWECWEYIYTEVRLWWTYTCEEVERENMNGHSLQELMYIQVLSGGGRMREQLCKK